MFVFTLLSLYKEINDDTYVIYRSSKFEAFILNLDLKKYNSLVGDKSLSVDLFRYTFSFKNRGTLLYLLKYNLHCRTKRSFI